MTILALAYNGLKALNALIFTPNPYKAVEHLNDDLLRDIGMYRDAGSIVNLNAMPLDKTEKTLEERTNAQVVVIPEHLKTNSG